MGKKRKKMKKKRRNEWRWEEGKTKPFGFRDCLDCSQRRHARCGAATGVVASCGENRPPQLGESHNVKKSCGSQKLIANQTAALVGVSVVLVGSWGGELWLQSKQPLKFASATVFE